ncbi:PREDICTED: aquaporin NIP3-1 [Tarenaya hassleriana]|uniref:aquaporin NIP3-1 n=1 Tax=Tarenaya hassleriana TaxID=28532 RepID=UPI00053C5EF1|nr:PREDICTED: aquaporin NIP3-1 [Tarenaya hassleriana]
MAEVSENAQSHAGDSSDVESAAATSGGGHGGSRRPVNSQALLSVSFVQKLIGEFIGTFALVFAGCSAIVVNERYGKAVTLPGIALVWGLTVTVMIYSIGHVSGAHFNPAVSVAFFSSKNFPLKQVPGYIAAQVLGSTVAAGILRLVFDLNDDVCGGKGDVFVGTYPSGSKTTSFVMEFVATFNLMFVISAVATDKRAAGPFAGVAIGSTVVLDILFSGPISGASMNPARSLGPAIVWGCYDNLWIYIISPVVGAISGAWAYDLLRRTDKSFREIIRTDCRKVSSERRRKDDVICLLKVIDPIDHKYFICSSNSDIDKECNVTCKFD